MGVTAVVSVATALYLRPQIPHLLSLPSRQQLLNEIDRRRRTQEALERAVSEKEELLSRYRESEARFRTMADSAPVLIWTSGTDKLCNYFNQKWLEFTGRALEDELGNGWVEGVYPEDRSGCFDTYVAAFDARAAFTMEYRLRRHDGAYRWILDSGVPRFDALSRFIGYIGSCVDITERKQAEQALQMEKSLRFTASIFQYSREGMMVTDADGVIVDTNPAFTTITGYGLAEVIGKRPNVLKSGRQDAAFYRDMWHSILEHGHWQGEVWNRKKDGELYAEWLTINAICNTDGSVHRYVALFSDITEKKQLDELIHRQVYFDALTELPNRRLFRDRLEQEIKKSKRNRLPFALLFIDLDRFKEINDTLGHDSGDLLLVNAARRIQGCLRESDTVARMGGDEFMAILPELKDRAHVEIIVSNIIRCLAEPFQMYDNQGYVSASVGITVFPVDADNAEGLIKNADQAMYSAKANGRNGFSYFTASMQTAAQARLNLTNDLRLAITEGQFKVYFQPIVGLSARSIVKAEALLRWQHPTRGFISPSEFIPVAEETGMIEEIGDWVFRQAALWAKRWQSLAANGLQVSVNISPMQLANASRFDEWLKYLEELDLPGNCVAVEITEGVLLKASADVDSRLQQLHDAGIQISIDDFGTGYSSLTFLNKFDIDQLKIDQSFIQGLSPDSRHLALTQAIIVMAHQLGITVVAEGVETEVQRDLVMASGCDHAQGFLYGKPLPAEEFEHLITGLGLL